MECGFLQSVSSSAVKIFKEGGLHGWFAVLCSFSTLTVWIALVKGLAVMLPTLQEQFDTSTWLIGWMIAIIDASVQFSAIFASPLREKFGVRAVVTVSGVLIGGAMIASAFTTSLSQVAIILSVFAGPAIGLSNIVTREAIGRCFVESRSTAFGVAALGSSLAFVTCVPLTQIFLDVYGWRGTMLLLGGIMSHLAVCGALMKEPATIGRNGEFQTVSVYEEPSATAYTGDEEPSATSDEEPSATTVFEETASNSRCYSCIRNVYTFISQTFKLDLFSSQQFWLIIFMVNIWMVMYTAWIIYFVPYTTVAKGFSLRDTSSFVVSFGIGRILGSISIGPLVQNIHVIGNSAWLGIGLLMMSLYYLIDPWLVSYWPVFVATLTYGYFDSVAMIQFDIVIIELFGANQMGIVLGWSGLVAGVSRVLLLYFPGLIYDILGSYTLAFTIIGAVHCLTVVALLALVWLQRRRPNKP